MVPKKEPLSRLVLPRSYLLIGKPRGENNRYWLPHWVKLLGRTSGGVRKDDILHPRLPRCCQNNLHCHSTYPSPFTLSLLPSLTSPPFLICQSALPPHCFMQIFISACEMYSQAQQQALNRSSGLSHTPWAAESASPLAFTQPLQSQVKSLTLDLVSSFHVVF